MYVILLCCGVLCGCLDESNRTVQCPQNWDHVKALFIERCKGDRQPLECECTNERVRNDH